MNDDQAVLRWTRDREAPSRQLLVDEELTLGEQFLGSMLATYERDAGLIGACAALVLAGCVNLEAVRTYATASAVALHENKAVHVMTISAKRASRYNRMLNGVAVDVERDAAAASDVDASLDVLEAYLNSLATLAGEQLATTDEQWGALAQEIGEHPRWGITTDTASAYANLASKISNPLLSGYQQEKLKITIKRYDKDVQELIAGLRRAMSIVSSVHSDTSKIVLGNNIDQEVDALANKQRLLGRIALYYQMNQEAVLASERQEIKAFDIVLARIAQGHAELADSVGQLEGKRLARILHAHVKAIRKARDDLVNATASVQATATTGGTHGNLLV